MQLTAEEAALVTTRMASVLDNPNMEGALTSVVDDYIDQLETSFAASVDPDGNAWEPIVYREVPPPPLVLSGALHDSVIADAQAAQIGMTSFETTGAQLVSYAAEQQLGGSYSSPKYVGGAGQYAKLYQEYITWFPGRPFIGFGDALIEKAVDHGIEDLNFQLLEALS